MDIAHDEIHIWSASVHSLLDSVPSFTVLLTNDEQHRARRFRQYDDRIQYIVGRGMLRSLLGWYLDEEPSSLLLSYGTYGKPYLSKTRRYNPIQFNLSHAGDRIVVAYTRDRAVGVDIESLASTVNFEDIAREHFTELEWQAWQVLPIALRKDAFFAWWTRKEAYLKAHGGGLHGAIRDFDVTFTPGVPIRLRVGRDSAINGQQWQLSEIRTFSGYVGV